MQEQKETESILQKIIKHRYLKIKSLYYKIRIFGIKEGWILRNTPIWEVFLGHLLPPNRKEQKRMLERYKNVRKNN